jgi:hypothetical protein
MNTRHCLKLAGRMDALLQHELGEGIDPRRMTTDGLYARDVLLVCEALRHTAGPTLAGRFRLAELAPEPAEPGTTPPPARRGSAFSAQKVLNSIFGPSTTLPPAEPAAAAQSRSWFGRLRSAQK